MSANAQRLGKAVRARRVELDLNQQDVADAGGPSDTTLSKLENGTPEVVSRATLRRLDVGLRWTPGTARAIYEGTSRDATVHPPPATTGSDLSRASIQELLREMQRRLESLTGASDDEQVISELVEGTREEPPGDPPHTPPSSAAG